MATDKFITLEQLDQTTQALLYKINEKADTKVDIENVNAILDSGVKIATIDEVDIYAPPGEVTEQDLSNAIANLATVASTGSYEDLTDKPTIPDTSTFMVKGTDYVTAGQLEGSTLGEKATAEGIGTTASGNDSHAEGYQTIASGPVSHAEGFRTTASSDYTHAEGSSTTASRLSAHAEGQNTTASGAYSHAEGKSTIASAFYTHAEGYYTTASQEAAHAEGSYTTASGAYSHAEGQYTTAQTRSQHVFGEYNILDTIGSNTTKGKYIEIVGNGTATNSRSNARTLDWSGNEVLAGKLTLGAAPTANMDAATKQYVDTALSNIDLTAYTPTTGLAAVALSGSYNDLSNLPTIPAAQVNSDWSASSGVAQILNKPDIPAAETDANVEDMLDSFDLDYTSNSISPNVWSGGSY